MRIWILLLGLGATFAALVPTGCDALLAEGWLHAKATLAGQLFTIPLAANVKL